MFEHVCHFFEVQEEKIQKEILSWPNVTAQPHKFGGIEFRVNKRETGHIHGEHVADLPFPMKTRNDLVNSGHVSLHGLIKIKNKNMKYPQYSNYLKSDINSSNLGRKLNKKNLSLCN